MIPAVLAVDTVGRSSGVALLTRNDLAFALDLGERGGHAEALLPAVLGLLEESGHRWENIDLLAVAEGPGSFTGVRVGVSFALGVSDARGVPALGVGSLDILARGCYDAIGLDTGTYVISSMEVRRGEVAVARFRVGAGARLSQEMDIVLISLSDPGSPPPSGSAVAGDAASLLWPEVNTLVRWPGTGPERAVAAARLAREGHPAGALSRPVPRYARPPQTPPRRP
jgi:tRNA threonylcarbamoyladenosine biosynthesis protein TsaB